MSVSQMVKWNLNPNVHSSSLFNTEGGIAPILDTKLQIQSNKEMKKAKYDVSVPSCFLDGGKRWRVTGRVLLTYTHTHKHSEGVSDMFMLRIKCLDLINSE